MYMFMIMVFNLKKNIKGGVILSNFLMIHWKIITYNHLTILHITYKYLYLYISYTLFNYTKIIILILTIN